MKLRTEEEYYIESKRLREETMRMADALNTQRNRPYCVKTKNEIE